MDTFIKDTSDEALLDEAILKCETVFTLIDREILLKNKGALALAYLALKYEKRKKEMMILKQGKNPTMTQKMFIHEQGLEWREWLVVKDTPELIEIVHRESEKVREYRK